MKTTRSGGFSGCAYGEEVGAPQGNKSFQSHKKYTVIARAIGDILC
jgi:hypothetical protein